MAKRAVVTGGARGIGAAIVERLRSDGSEVAVLDLVASEGVIGCDVTDPEAVREAAIEIILSSFIPVSLWPDLCPHILRGESKLWCYRMRLCSLSTP